MIRFAVVLLGCLLAGCVSSPGASAPRADGAPVLDPRLQQQANAALERWARAVAAGVAQGVVTTGELTGQVGDWEERVGDNNKLALMAGLVEATVDLPTERPPDGQLRMPDGSTQTVRVLSAEAALADLTSEGDKNCPGCVPLRVSAARLTTGPVQTGRGAATGPIWEFTVEGTEVRITRVAIADPIVVQQPTWNPADPPVGIRIDSATGPVGGRQLTVTFTGAPDPGDRPCGADYSAQAVESASAVVVIVIEHPHAPGETCTMVGASRTTTVDLAAPLGERAVLDVVQGIPVPVVPTP